jgi:hypothetical protein
MEEFFNNIDWRKHRRPLLIFLGIAVVITLIFVAPLVALILLLIALLGGLYFAIYMMSNNL